MIVIVSPPGPFPKNWGWLLSITSPSFKLSRITLVGFVNPELVETLNFDSWVAPAGKFKLRFGFSPF